MKEAFLYIVEKTGDTILNALRRIPVVGKLVSMQFRLKTFVAVAVLIASYISFNATYVVVSSMYRKSFIRNADEVSDAVALQVHNSMLQLMQRGWTRAELKDFLRSVKGMSGELPIDVEIFRGETVEEDYGRIPQPAKGRYIVDSFQTGDAITFKPYPVIINIYPIKAQQECLHCHTHARGGEVLGVMKIRQDISPAIKEAKRRFTMFFFFLLPIPFLMAGAVTMFLNARIKRSTVSFHEKVSEINSVKDLTKLNHYDDVETGFTEFNTILGEFTGFARKIRDVAIDREVLEFELRLLEKFIITSDVVKDWKGHVMNLLLEINKVIKAYALFSVFRVDDKIGDVEVFWTQAPSATMKDKVERIIMEKVARENNDLGGVIPGDFHHNIAEGALDTGGAGEIAVELQTKSVILQNPRIRGVVGIGVESAITRDTIRSLVIDSILTTLLNVVGSVKAMHKYTGDLEYYATRDPLTNLYNQRLFWELLGYEIGRAQRHGEKFSLLVIDLDNFKNINDSHGHIFGDSFLCGVATTIHGSLREGDILARYGGDEFVVVLPEADEEQAFLVASRIRERVGMFTLETHDATRVKATVSMGYAVYPVHAASAKDLFMFSDNMMYKAKSEGKDTVLIPTEEDVLEVFRSTGEMTLLITKAIEEKTVVPYFQPIVNVETGRVEGHEVLSRIDTPQGVLEAEQFIEVTERLGVIGRHDALVMEKVFRKVSDEGYRGYIFINLSPKSLILKEFIPGLLKLTRTYSMRHSDIVFEITERDTVKNISLLEKFVHDLKSEGFKFAIDDFGSGFSSFNYVRRFPIDFLKIEGEFIRTIVEDRKSLAFVKTIATLAGEFGIKSIVEGVENEETLAAIRQIGIDYVQGYHSGRPSPELTRDIAE